MATTTAQESTSETVTIDANPSIFQKSVVRTRFGPKVVLGGSTYEAFVECGLKDELDWDTTHYEFDDEREKWLVDGSDESLEAVKNGVEEIGFDWGGVGQKVIETLRTVVEMDADEPTMWEEKGVELTVRYTSARSKSTMQKSGVVSGTDSIANKVYFRRDDGITMNIAGDDVKTQNHKFPFVGWVESVDLSFETGAGESGEN